jgi:predicted transcriptional regulator
MSTNNTKEISSAVLSVRVPESLKEQLDYLSRSTKRSKGYLATEALGDYVKKNAWRAKELQAAIAEADKGVFISHEAMLVWADARHAQKNPALPKTDIRLRKKSI